MDRATAFRILTYLTGTNRNNSGDSGTEFHIDHEAFDAYDSSHIPPELMLNVGPIELEKQSGLIHTSKRSGENNLISQIFESNSSSARMKKLDLIELPEYAIRVDDEVNLGNRKVYFAGKVLIGQDSQPRYANLFTIIFT